MFYGKDPLKRNKGENETDFYSRKGTELMEEGLNLESSLERLYAEENSIKKKEAKLREKKKLIEMKLQELESTKQHFNNKKRCLIIDNEEFIRRRIRFNKMEQKFIERKKQKKIN